MTDKYKNLSKDPIMRTLMEKHQLKEYWGGNGNLFLDLIDIVTGQQLSLKAAATIYKRFLDLFPTATPTPEEVLKVSLDKLRSVGLSTSKANYVHNIAQAVVNKSLPLDQFENQTDEQIKNELLKIKGLGPWSAEMFLIFSLKRPDIFSVGDLGIRVAISRLYGIDREDKKKILEISKNWRPHRSLACRYLWASLEN